MKSIVDFILESKINESLKELKGLSKILVHGKPEQIYDNIVKIVDTHSNDTIAAKDIDSLEDGMLIGYMQMGNGDKAACISVADTEDKEWIVYNIYLHKSGNVSRDAESVKFGDKLYSEWYGNGWTIYYIEHTDDDILKSVVRCQNTFGKN